MVNKKASLKLLEEERSNSLPLMNSVHKRPSMIVKQSDIKENFCGACLTIPLAFAGAGTAFGAENKAKLKQWAIVITIVSVLFTIYFIWIRKCKTCRLR
jgi:hypothetical protein